MGKFIPQCKGKDRTKIAKSKMLHETTLVMATVKYDGNYVQIHVDGPSQTCEFYTSSGKQFYSKFIANELLGKNADKRFVIEAEYCYGCKGKLGDRPNSAKLTTYRTQFSKGVLSSGSNKDTLFVFDILGYEDSSKQMASEVPYYIREQYLAEITYCDSVVNIPIFSMTVIQAIEWAKEIVNMGWEGCVIKTPDHKYLPGKRVNNCVKLKYRRTALLTCLAIVEGKGKYENLIGGLLLQDDAGIQVSVGSGLTDNDRRKQHSYFIGKSVKISYEQVLTTYIQPTYKKVI